MKKLLIYGAVLFAVMGCKSSWEYQIVTVSGAAENDFFSRNMALREACLDSLGAEHWELVGMFTTTETVHPNFGDAKYVTGLQPNVRSQSVNFVFKRPK